MRAAGYSGHHATVDGRVTEVNSAIPLKFRVLGCDGILQLKVRLVVGTKFQPSE